MKRVGVDVGGTFTDIIYLDDVGKKVIVHKVPTTADDPSRGVIDGHRSSFASATASLPPTIDYVFHGTTIATNAILEHRRRRNRHDHHRGLSRHPPYRPPSAAAALLDHAGDALAGPAAGASGATARTVRGAAGSAARRGARAARRGGRARRAARELREEGVEAIAVCFLFSYLNPGARGARREIVREEYARRASSRPRLVGVAAVPRVRALHHRVHERLRRAEGARLCQPGSTAALREAGFKRRPAHHGSNGGVATPAMVAEKPGADAAVGAGRRRARRRLGAARCRAGAT